ncbi:hypothetical protein FPV67DRAFT_1705064 [Lyophyllum atratum]|nr:hypothetical protein FPV67DRAFT_1705064 [Lyophyllum atratum]
MRVSTIFNIALVAFVAAPSTLAQPVETAEALYARDLAHGTAIEARQLESYINDMILERSFAGEDVDMLEARFLPIWWSWTGSSSIFSSVGGLRILGKGVKAILGSGN